MKFELKSKFKPTGDQPEAIKRLIKNIKKHAQVPEFEELIRIIEAPMKYEEDEYFKTGTLTNVRTRAGYLLGKDDRVYPYVIMVNEKNFGYESILSHLKNIVKNQPGKKKG